MIFSTIKTRTFANIKQNKGFLPLVGNITRQWSSASSNSIHSIIPEKDQDDHHHVQDDSKTPLFIQDWEKEMKLKRVVEHDTIEASLFNLMGNTLDDPIYRNDHLPSVGTELPPGWHLAYFPPRCPESSLSKDGYEQDWKPPTPFDHRVWAGGQVRWHPHNRLRVGQKVSMHSKLRKTDYHPGGKRGDTLFTWVDKSIHNEEGWAVIESRCWAFVKDQEAEQQNNDHSSNSHVKEILSQDIIQNPDFRFTWTPSPVLLFRFSALTFNSHLIHYDQAFAQQVEKQEDCLVHGPLSFTWLASTLNRHVRKTDTNRHIESLEYRCLSPLVVRHPLEVAGKQRAGSPGTYDLWVLNDKGQIAVHGVANVGFSM
ncbi:unnamed protein product [Cunninghamella blakesleeana]